MKKNSIIKNENGFIAVIFMFIMAMLGALAIGALQMTTLNFESSSAQSKGKKAFYAAEVGLDLAINEIMQSFENLTFYGTTAENGGDDKGFITVDTYRDHEVKFKIENSEPRFLYETVNGNSILSHYAYTYDIEAQSTSLSDKSKEKIFEKIRILQTPLIQWFAFYGGNGGNDSDIEITPGPEMVAWGRIHSNGDIYMRAKCTGGLRFQNFDPNLDAEGISNPIASPHSLTASGIIYNKKKSTMKKSCKPPLIKTSNLSTEWEDFTPIDLIIDQDSEETAFKDFVFVNEPIIQAPDNTLFQRGGFYESRSADTQRPDVDGIQIIGQGGLGTGISVIISSPLPNTDVTQLIKLGQKSSGISYSGPMPIIRETKGLLNDCREKRSVDTTDIDLYALEKWYEEYLADPSNGPAVLGEGGILVFASRSPNASFTNSANPMQAIRLKKNVAGSVPKLISKTTFASDNPVYIQGDFNTINTQGAAIIGDAINLLSNDWKDTKKCNGGLPSAGLAGSTGIKVRAALFGGTTPTTGQNGIYGGGLHNYKRYHENWDNVNADFKGSLIGLWKSRQANAKWCIHGDCYEPPERQYGWDTTFADPDFWPPFIPSIFGVERVGYLE